MPAPIGCLLQGCVVSGASKSRISREFRNAELRRAKDPNSEIRVRGRTVTGTLACAAECPVDESFFSWSIRQLQRKLSRGESHFLPGFLQRINHFLVVGFAGEIGELM